MSSPHGTRPSGIEVTDISPHGIWVLAQGEEIFLPYEKFPWFKQGSVEAVLKVEEQSPGHYYWPDLDIDLGIDSMREPDRYPLSFDANT
jgi:hypothetical protein